jgi:hypothetical protein
LSEDRLNDLVTHALIAASYASELSELLDQSSESHESRAALAKRASDVARHTAIVARLAQHIVGGEAGLPQWTDRPRIGRRHELD